MTKVKIFCFIDGKFGGCDLRVYAIAENGIGMACHISRDETWAKHDIGATSDRKHDIYKAKFGKDGYELIWIDDINDPQLQKVLHLNKEKAK